MTEHVKIYGVKPRIQYVANGTLSSYEFPFAIFNTSDIDVYFGSELQNTDSYTVSEARHSDGGSVTFNSAPASGTVITIARNLSIERTSDFQEGSALRSKVLNDELDYQTACQQQIADTLNRSMVLPPYAADIDVNLTLPTPSAGKAIVWNAQGTNLENSTVSVNALESTLNGYKTDAQNAAAISANKASVATSQAQTATAQATIATQKAELATTALSRLTHIQTNCVTGMPQNVDLELSEGVLTLKTGSKVYVPNGSGTFNEITVAQDISGIRASSQTCFVFVNGTSFYFMPIAMCFSGATAPSEYQYMTWYDTGNNFVKSTSDTGSTWTSGLSLPIAVITSSDGAISSIDKVFNGLGYIGSSLFALPGVSFLRMNGRNADGTLKTVETSLSTVSVYTCTGTLTGTYNIIMYANAMTVATTDYDGTPANGRITLDMSSNISYSSLFKTAVADIGSVTVSSGIISDINPKTAFHAIDYNDLEHIWAYQSNQVSPKLPSVIVAEGSSEGIYYVKFSSGLMYQWCPNLEAASSSSVTLAEPFVNTNYTVTVSNTSNSGGYALSVEDKTTTGFKINATAGAISHTKNWFAVGYWK